MELNEQKLALAEFTGLNICPRCYHEIDKTVCHCGDAMNAHGMGSGHNPVPYGCTCGYSDAEKRRATEPECPDFLNDLNVIHGAEKLLSDESKEVSPGTFQSQREAFLEILEVICGNHMDTWEFDMVHATANQRAEALLKTIGKWKP